MPAVRSLAGAVHTPAELLLTVASQQANSNAGAVSCGVNGAG
jgi:hypothetical protein